AGSRRRCRSRTIRHSSQAFATYVARPDGLPWRRQYGNVDRSPIGGDPEPVGATPPGADTGCWPAAWDAGEAGCRRYRSIAPTIRSPLARMRGSPTPGGHGSITLVAAFTSLALPALVVIVSVRRRYCAAGFSDTAPQQPPTLAARLTIAAMRIRLLIGHLPG